ncbi:MAG: hypothetical protein R3B07_35390 [Polyangiaceae bacterium]
MKATPEGTAVARACQAAVAPARAALLEAAEATPESAVQLQAAPAAQLQAAPAAVAPLLVARVRVAPAATAAGAIAGTGQHGGASGYRAHPSGSIQVTTDGAVIEDLDIQGEVQILADNVTIRRCRITSGDYYPIRYFDNDNVGLLVEDTEIIQDQRRCYRGDFVLQLHRTPREHPRHRRRLQGRRKRVD